MASPDLAQLMTEAMVPLAVAPRDYLVVAPVALSMLFGAALLCLRRRPERHTFIALPGFALVFLVDLLLLRRVASEGPVTMMMGAWKPPFGIAFTVDLMGALFLVTAGFVALVVAVHAAVSVPARERRYGFFPLFFLLMTGVSGAFLTGDLFNLYVWFEVLLIASFGLLIVGSERAQLDGATKYCFLNLVATTLFLVATGYTYGVFGTLNMADIAMKASAAGEDGVLVSIATMFFVAFGMKAAAFPLNAWLPASYHTPRFVVSALFAGLLTKVGIYALIRVLLMLFPPERVSLGPVIAWVAGLTMIVGALGALAQSDIRKLLNYVVVAGIGTILAGLALPALQPIGIDLAAVGALDALGQIAPAITPAAADALRTGLSGAIFYALHSMMVMTALYLAAGVAVQRAGSSSLHEMGGLWQRFPSFSALFLVLLLAVSGLPPFSGFWPKLGLVRATLAAEMPWLAAAILVSGFLLTIACARVFALAFWRPEQTRRPSGEGADDIPSADDVTDGATPLLPVATFVAVVVIVGLLPEGLSRLSTAAASGVLDPAAYLGSVFGGAP